MYDADIANVSQTAAVIYSAMRYMAPMVDKTCRPPCSFKIAFIHDLQI